MVDKKRKEDHHSGFMISMKILGNKWKACIINVISRGEVRPSEIHRQIPEASPRVIDMQLRELIDLGIVTKEMCGGFPLCTDYVLTEVGKSLLPVISSIEKWGIYYKEVTTLK